MRKSILLAAAAVAAMVMAVPAAAEEAPVRIGLVTAVTGSVHLP